MNKLQFWGLNVVSLILALLLLSHFFFARHNNRLGQALERDRAAINKAQQLEGVLDQLAKRIAKGSDTDPKLKQILVKYGLNVTLEVDGKKKSYP
jgi:transcription elongation GreA/GreB family factor